MTRMIIALEGPCLSGKSTVAHQLTQMAADCLVFPCYVAELSVVPPEPVASSQAEQLASTALFLEIESKRFDRVTSSTATLVLLDRSIDTLAAHALAVAHYLAKPGGYSDTLSLIRGEPKRLVPDVTFFLEVPTAELRRRSASFPHLPPVYYDPSFLRGFREHFEGGYRFARDFMFVDARGDSQATASRILQEVAFRSMS